MVLATLSTLPITTTRDSTPTKQPGVSLTLLQRRADSLRRLAGSVDPILANSYRRRASELELEVWIHLVRSGLAPEDSPLAA